MTIIAVVNSKGGVGKSTVAVHLAAWLYEEGHRVLLADCDTQHSSSEWLREACPDVESVILDEPHAILKQLPTLAHEFDYVVADGPGSHTETSRSILLRADLAIVPCKASMLEVRALAKATEVLSVSQEIRGGKPDAIVVLNMVGKRYRLTADMLDAAASLDLPMAATPLILRQAYADSPGQGLLVWQMGPKARAAADETLQLFEQILPEAKRTKRITKSRRTA